MFNKKNGTIAILTAFVIALSASSSFAVSPDAADAYNKALDYYVSGDSKKAVKYFEKSVKEDPEFADAYYNLGSLYRYLEDLEQAEGAFKKYLSLNPKDTSVNYELGLLYIQKKDYSKALDYLKKLTPESERFHDAQGKIALIVTEIKGNSSPTQSITTVAAKPSSDHGFKEIQVKQSQETSLEEVSGCAYMPEDDKNLAVNYMSIADTAEGNLKLSPQKALVDYSASENKTELVPRSAIKTFASGFDGPTGIARDSQGNLFVANYAENKIYKVSPSGQKSVFAQSKDINGPIGLAIDNANNLYVANYLSNSIAKVTSSGETSVIATGLNKPYLLFLDNTSTLYVSEQDSNTVSKINLAKRR